MEQFSGTAQRGGLQLNYGIERSFDVHLFA
jgi:hypothetical protein